MHLIRTVSRSASAVSIFPRSRRTEVAFLRNELTSRHPASSSRRFASCSTAWIAYGTGGPSVVPGLAAEGAVLVIKGPYWEEKNGRCIASFTDRSRRCGSYVISDGRAQTGGNCLKFSFV